MTGRWSWQAPLLFDEEGKLLAGKISAAFVVAAGHVDGPFVLRGGSSISEPMWIFVVDKKIFFVILESSCASMKCT